MSKLYKLIDKLCPEGVKYKELGNICSFQKGASITKKDAAEGTIPVIAGGQKPAYYINKHNREGYTITISSSGVYSGYVSFWNEPIFVSDAFTIEPKKNLNIKYLYHFLKNEQDMIYRMQKGSGVPHVYATDVSILIIPLLPLPVQEEIVRILDNFTELTVELTTKLTAELTARKKQYEYYRDELLAFGGGARLIGLKECTNISRGVRVVKSQLDSAGPFPVYQNSLTPLGYYNKSNCDAGTTFLISGGAAGEVGYSYVDFWAADDCFCFECHDYLLNRFLYYILLNKQHFIRSRVRKDSIPRLSRTVVEKIQVPIPPLSEQARIVSILDRFDALVNDISVGLPAEIAARQKQYEYYRDKLLTFKEVGT